MLLEPAPGLLRGDDHNFWTVFLRGPPGKRISYTIAAEILVLDVDETLGCFDAVEVKILDFPHLLSIAIAWQRTCDRDIDALERGCDAWRPDVVFVVGAVVARLDVAHEPPALADHLP